MREDFNPWPCGPVPEKWHRPEIKRLREAGYDLDDMEIIEAFEEKISDLAGSKYGVAISSCTNAIFLSLMYLKDIGEIEEGYRVTIPARTYMSVPMAILNAGFKVGFEHKDWNGIYQLFDTRAYDCATRFTKGMYVGDNALQSLSFQYKKRLPIGRGGMVLTDDLDAVKWLKVARFNGRNPDVDQWHDIFTIRGWNMYMTPDDAARGILIMDNMSEVNPDNGCQDNYQDLSNQEIFK